MEPASATFTTAARELSRAARSCGLAVPGFRSPPRLAGADRTLRRSPDGAVVAIRLRGRPAAAVVVDMVEGILVVNRLTGPDAERTRESLLAATTSLEG